MFHSNFTLCMNKEYDEHGQEKSKCYIVESLRDGDCFSKSKTVYEVSHILSKDNSAKKYSNLVFIHKRANMWELSGEISSMIEEGLSVLYQ